MLFVQASYLHTAAASARRSASSSQSTAGSRGAVTVARRRIALSAFARTVIASVGAASGPRSQPRENALSRTSLTTSPFPPSRENKTDDARSETRGPSLSARDPVVRAWRRPSSPAPSAANAAAEAVDDTLRLGASPEAVAAAAFAALGAGEPGLRSARTTGSRLDRLGPRVADRASSVLFSRDGGNGEVVKDRESKAFARGWLHGPDAAPTEAQTVRANAEASIRRRATATAPREPVVDWLELADRRAEAAAAASCV